MSEVVSLESVDLKEVNGVLNSQNDPTPSLLSTHKRDLPIKLHPLHHQLRNIGGTHTRCIDIINGNYNIIR